MIKEASVQSINRLQYLYSISTKHKIKIHIFYNSAVVTKDNYRRINHESIISIVPIAAYKSFFLRDYRYNTIREVIRALDLFCIFHL